MDYCRFLLICTIMLVAQLSSAQRTIGVRATAKKAVFRIEVAAAANVLLQQNGYSPDHGSSDRVTFVLGDDRLLDLLENAGFEYDYETIEGSMVPTVGIADFALQLVAQEPCLIPMDAYPDYDLYESLMTGFAADFPEIAILHELGELPSGRKILALEITDQPNLEENEPKLLYTSSMHGDELGGYHIGLRLIAHLLCAYGQEAEITELLQSTEIWINPLANPDGAYRDDNATIINPSRGNANFIDLNRNFPDPDNGPHPDGNPYQPETEIFMDFAQTYRFDLSLNVHGGAEVFNYPWDTYAQRTADDGWWINLARDYADTCQDEANFNGYMDALNNGITNGYDWYPIFGGRQDYVNYYQRGREATLEISNTKTVPPTDFESLWNYNQRALINFFASSLDGVRGVVTDSITGAPIEASVLIPDHDELNSDVYSKLPTGRYHRYLSNDTYTFLFSAAGYHPKTITYSVNDGQANLLDVHLAPINSSLDRTLDNSALITANYQAGSLYLNHLPEDHCNWQLELLGINGQHIARSGIPGGQRDFNLRVGYLPPGVYICRVHENGQQKILRFSTVVRKK